MEWFSAGALRVSPNHPFLYLNSACRHRCWLVHLDKPARLRFVKFNQNNYKYCCCWLIHSFRSVLFGFFSKFSPIAFSSCSRVFWLYVWPSDRSEVQKAEDSRPEKERNFWNQRPLSSKLLRRPSLTSSTDRQIKSAWNRHLSSTFPAANPEGHLNTIGLCWHPQCDAIAN